MVGTGSTDRSDDREEVRFAVVLNGGVSLAVWMGGVVREIDAATQGYDGDDDRPTHAYGRLMHELRIRARADVITGTSAGGINGAALALGQVNRRADLGMLRDLWAEQGRMETLLQRPFTGKPASLLRGEEYFLPRLEEAMKRLCHPWEERTPREHRPVDLTITATLLSGALQTTTDSMGAVLPQRRHDGLFRFRRGCEDETPNAAALRARARAGQASGSKAEQPGRNDFDHDDRDMPLRLALAARCSAGFPGAFEPSYVPVRRLVQGRPDMGAVANWKDFRSDHEDVDLSRFAVDGGVLSNTPTRQALGAIQGMVARTEVQRVMLLVFPHAPSEREDTPDEQDAAPALAGSMASILTALRADGGRTHVEQIEDHNRRAATRRASREEILLGRGSEDRESKPEQELLTLAGQLYFVYRKQRIQRAARDLPGRIRLPEGWFFERARRACQAAQELFGSELPYVPLKYPSAKAETYFKAWPLGATAALDFADIALAVVESLRRLDDPPKGLDDAAEKIHETMGTIRAVRRELDDSWLSSSLPTVPPNRGYWTKRLIAYRDFMAEPGATMAGQANPRCGGGADLGICVLTIVRQLRTIWPWDQPLTLSVSPWATLFQAYGADWTETRKRDTLFRRLLALHIVSWAVGDEFTNENTRPIGLVQISAQTQNQFAVHSRSMVDKLGSESLGRFSGFLRTSWRMNDWTWGRLDAATHLFRVLVTPARVRAYAARLRGPIVGWTPSHRAAMFGWFVRRDTIVVQALVSTVLEVELPPGLGYPRDNAVGEVGLLLTHRDRDDDPLVHLPPLLAYARHVETIAEDLPAIADGARIDHGDGAGERSAGTRFLEQHSKLLADLEEQRVYPDEVDAKRRFATGMASLTALDRAGIGRERWSDVASSDQVIRTAVTGAAVAASLVDSPASGLGRLKPVTRFVRGAMMVPYWVTLGLTSAGTLARALAGLVLAAGGALLTLALLGVIPLAGIWAMVGAGVLLFAFAYGAARTGSTLHSYAFLTAALLAAAMARQHTDEPGQRSATAVAVLVVIGVVIVLGSIPNPLVSPTVLFTRIGPVSAAFAAVAVVGLLLALRARQDIAREWRSARDRWQNWWPPDQWQANGWWPPSPIWLVATAVVLLLAGAWAVAHLATTKLAFVSWVPMQPASNKGEVEVATSGVWVRETISHPSSMFAAWSCVYGAAYLVAALVLAVGGWFGTPWVIVVAAIGAAFTWVMPLTVTTRARGAILRRIRKTVASDKASGMDAPPQLADEARFAHWLIRRGWGYRFLLEKGGDDFDTPGLTRRGSSLFRELVGQTTL